MVCNALERCDGFADEAAVLRVGFFITGVEGGDFFLVLFVFALTADVDNDKRRKQDHTKRLTDNQLCKFKRVQDAPFSRLA